MKEANNEDDISKGSRSKVTRGQGQRSGSNVKVTINVEEKAGGLTPMSSCFIESEIDSILILKIYHSILSGFATIFQPRCTYHVTFGT